MIYGLPEIELFEKGHRACAGCGSSIAMRHALKAAGKDTIVVMATGCMEVVSTPYPETSWKVPWIHGAFENAAAIASGVERALKKLGKKTKVLVIAGDGGTFDIGLQALSGAIERRHDVCYICYDNSAYQNTGNQRSGATPKYADTTTSPAGKKIHGKIEYAKPMPLIVAAHGCYVATANIAYPVDFVKKVQKGLAVKGPAYVQVYCPCVPGWRYPQNLTVEIAKLAFEAKVTPLYEIDNGILSFSRKPARNVPVRDYLNLQGRFRHLNEKEIKEIQERIDSEYKKLLNLEKHKIKI